MRASRSWRRPPTDQEHTMDTRADPSVSPVQRRKPGSIVVGVDARARSASALVWAVDEADRTGAHLRLVTAGRNGSALVGEHDLGALARRLSLVDVDQRSVQGDPVDVLLDSAV